MTDQSLAVSYIEVAALTGRYLGFGRGATFYEELAWNTKQARDIKENVKSGLRRFYETPPIDHFDPGAYEWSFLSPVATVTLKSGEQTIELPDDYASVTGQLTLVADDSISSVPINFFGPYRVYEQYAQQPSTTGRPLMACEEPLKGRSSILGQKMRLKVWPIADQDYSLNIPYRINAPALSGEFPFAYGGQQHHETIVASCIAAAERNNDDKKAEKWADFMERLQTSIRLDRLNKPQFMGRNRDRSDVDERYARQSAIRGAGLVTVNGTQY